MNYYKARQNQETSKWKYTMSNDGKFYEVGYCATDGCKGHDTYEEACEHYKQYILDKQLHFYNPKDGDTMNKCEICGEFTFGHVTVGACEFHYLCKKHQTKEDVSRLMGNIDEIISSY